VAGFTDVAPWPPVGAGANAITVLSASGPLGFTLGRGAGYTDIPDPVVGQTIAFYNPATGTFVAKRISSVSKTLGSPPWTIACTSANGASDTSYTPAVGQMPCPWSPSLPALVPPLLAAFDAFGPGEQVASFFDAGRRQRRQPPPGADAPSAVGARLVNGVQDLAAVRDAQLVDPVPSALPVPTTVGAPGTLSYLRTLRYLAVFPLT
jgi:hypothetical protein